VRAGWRACLGRTKLDFSTAKSRNLKGDFQILAE